MIKKKTSTPKFQQLKCQDHTVSQEYFELQYDENLLAYTTIPVPENLARYYESVDYISHSDRRISFIDKVYQVVRKYTLKRKLKLINSLGTPRTLLDVGCGTGDFVKTCVEKGWKCVGIEPNEQARNLALQKSDAQIHSDIDLIDEQFDVITLWHVLEHVSDVERYLGKLQKLLLPNGRIIIAVPNYNSYDADFYKSHWAAFDVPRHLWHFSQSSIKKLVAPLQMKVERTRGMKFDAYYVSMLSEKYKHGRMNLIKAFWIGFKSNWHASKNSEYSSLIYIVKNDN